MEGEREAEGEENSCNPGLARRQSKHKCMMLVTLEFQINTKWCPAVTGLKYHGLRFFLFSRRERRDHPAWAGGGEQSVTTSQGTSKVLWRDTKQGGWKLARKGISAEARASSKPQCQERIAGPGAHAGKRSRFKARSR